MTNKETKYPAFEAWLEANNIPFTAEARFADDYGRQWRTDYFFENAKVRLAVEVEGGAFSGGRHTRGAGFTSDVEKYNFYTFMGIKLLRVQPIHVTKYPVLVVNAIKSILDGSNYIETLKALFPKKEKKRFDLEAWLLEHGWTETSIEKPMKNNKYFGKMYKGVLMLCRLNSRFFSTHNDLGSVIDEQQPHPKTKKAASEIFSPKRLMK